MRTNVAVPGPDTRTHEGTPAPRLTPIKSLRRAVLTALLWEETLYESGDQIAHGIADLIPQCKPVDVAALAVEARDTMYLRHVPLFLMRELAHVKGNGTLVADTLAHIIQRPDELSEYLSLYWRGQADAEKSSLSAGSKRGLARAFQKFTAYSLAKYDQDAAIKLRDVLFLVHAKPKDPGQAAVWAQLVTRTLPTPETWETGLSAGKDKHATWERLLRDGKLGGLAFLRNLRNMMAADVDLALVRAYFDRPVFDKVLPFRFISAARHVPRLEPELEAAMLRSVASLPKLAGTTALVIDTSPSMWQAKVSAKSELDRFDAAAALAILAREVCASVHVWAFNERAYEVPARRGFALRDALAATKAGASCGGLAVEAANARGYDRIIVMTDGQWHYMIGGGSFMQNQLLREGTAQDVSPAPLTAKAYMVNVAPYQHGVGGGRWQSINGWSEHILAYIAGLERETLA